MKKLEFISTGILILATLYGCNATTGGTQTEEKVDKAVAVEDKVEQTAEIASSTKASKVTMSNRLTYGKNSNIPSKVKAECLLDTQLPQHIESFAANYDIAVVKKGSTVSKSDPGKVLVVEFSDVIGAGGGAWSGSKSVAVTGKLYDNGKLIGSFIGRRSSGGGMFGAYKGTCSILGRCVKALGKDISDWLFDPSMDARLGEL